MANTFEFKCNKCGKPAKQDDAKSNENWRAFKCGEKCECGGTFVLHIDGKPLEK